MERWELGRKIEKLIEDNCKDYDWEGTEVDKQGLKEDILELIDSIEKGIE